MTYTLSSALSPFARLIQYHYLQVRPRPNDTVGIVAVIVFNCREGSLAAIEAILAAHRSMREQMEQDLRQQAVDMNIFHCYWYYEVEAHYVNS